MNFAARLISHIANPLMIAAAAFSSLAWRLGDWRVACVGIVVYAILPATVWAYLYHTGAIVELYPSGRAERANLLLLGVICYGVGCLVLVTVGVDARAWGTGLSFSVNTLLVYLINRSWKISIHTVGVGGAFVILLLLEGSDTWPMGVIVVLTSWARLHLKAHTPMQLVAGLALGGIGSVVVILLSLPFACQLVP